MSFPRWSKTGLASARIGGRRMRCGGWRRFRARSSCRNEYKITIRSSRMDLLTNPDGSVDLYFGPNEPKGKRQNWIPTESGRAFFAIFSLAFPAMATP